MTQKIEELNPSEMEWINAQLETAREIVMHYSPDDVPQPLTLKMLDSAFTEFYRGGGHSDMDTVNAFLNALGVAFGQYLVDRLGLQWVAVTDEESCELAVIGMRGEADFMVFPPNFVAKRWARGEAGFFVHAYKKIADQYAELKAKIG